MILILGIPLPRLFVGQLEKMRKPTSISDNILSFSEGTAAIYLAFEQSLRNNKAAYTEMGLKSFKPKRSATVGDNQESPGTLF